MEAPARIRPLSQCLRHQKTGARAANPAPPVALPHTYCRLPRRPRDRPSHVGLRGGEPRQAARTTADLY